MSVPVRFLWPWYWPAWFALGLTRVFARLSYPTLLRTCSALGTLARWVLPLQRRIVRRNLELCLPALDRSSREQILREHFRNLGITIGETALSWWDDGSRIRALAQIEGLEHVDRALERGRGVILLAAHFTTLEMGARIMTLARPVHPMYKPTRNPLIAEYMIARRAAQSAGAIANDDIRSVVRTLRANGVIWYAPDQAYRHRGAELVPFFGIPVATNTATSRLARSTGAAVLPYFVERLPDAGGYRVQIGAALEDFPSDDAVADTLRYHALIEAEVRRIPAQYLWVHRRLKGLGPDAPDYYA
jgi:Kdo2-lipid IVA lauroyltransferase/acyltransferase